MTLQTGSMGHPFLENPGEGCTRYGKRSCEGPQGEKELSWFEEPKGDQCGLKGG